MPARSCQNKVRYRSERAAKAAVRRRIKEGDVTATNLRAYRCDRHNCFHIGNSSTALKYISFMRPPKSTAD